ncbi:right-handed parallel beta-helix repeat-containing protein [Flavobacterium davisii]|uniref:Right-handed parallel beta-helix repeat-containing protein n=1 Tax=Flavobacterium columnare TaxID=996 RepID=A0A8G0KT11_9FLAO|nr:right-handed parallel beta-helix repeat-containing protein [Flavobacterium davisii]QYS89662.1 right-handed parallel beta-helix repeat-containing protein [Flavobacterium davisii]
MKKIFITLIVLVLVVFIFNRFYKTDCSIPSKNYYVSPNGNDANPRTMSSPWKTIQHSLNNMSANSTLYVDSGIYNEKIQIPINHITIKNQKSKIPIIDATGITKQNSIIAILNKNSITIDGLELRNNIQNDAQGILIEGLCNAITIKNCIIHDIHFSSNPKTPVNASTNAQGIIVYGTNPTRAIRDLVIENNKLFNCRLGYSEGIAINGNVKNFKVIDNNIHDLTNIGIDLIGYEGTCPLPKNDQARNGLIKNNIIYNCISPSATSGGIYIDGGKNIIIENNESHHNGYGIEIGCEHIGKTTDSVIIRNNIFYNNQIYAIALGGFDYPNGSGKVTNSTITNNTCFSNGLASSDNGELYLSYSENSTIENNIFYTNSNNNLVYAESNQPDLNFNYNIFYCPDGINHLYANWNGSSYTGYLTFVTGTSSNLNSRFTNPNFTKTDISPPCFNLLSSSLNN